MPFQNSRIRANLSTVRLPLTPGAPAITGLPQVSAYSAKVSRVRTCRPFANSHLTMRGYSSINEHFTVVPMTDIERTMKAAKIRAKTAAQCIVLESPGNIGGERDCSERVD